MQVVDAVHRLPGEPHDQVAHLDAGAARGAAFLHRLDAHGARVVELEMPREAPRERQVGAGEAEEAAAYLAILQELQHHPLHRVDRGGEADALRARDDRRVDADHLAVRIDQRPAGIAGIEGRVGLQHIIDQPAGLRAQTAPERAHHAGGDRVLESVRVADGDRELADAHAARRAEHHRGQRVAADADDGDVGVGILADEIGVARQAVGESGADVLRAVHYVAVREQQPVGREREARAGAAAALELYLEMRDCRAYGLRGRYHGCGIGIERPSVIRRRGRAGCAPLAFVQQELRNRFQDIRLSA